MPTGLTSKKKRIRYLLGLSSAAEREHIEWEYFEDEHAFQEMLTAEDDLIDAYVCGELGDDERRRFEGNFLNSLRGRDRLQFARALAGAVCVTPAVDTKRLRTSPAIFRTFRTLDLLRGVTITAVIVVVAVLAWLVNDRRRITHELHELRAESLELNKRIEALQRSSDTGQTRTAGIGLQPADLRARRRTTQRARHVPGVENERAEIAGSKPKPAQLLLNKEDATLGSNPVNKQITQLPLEVRNVPNLLTLQAAATRGGYLAGNRIDQTNVILDGADVDDRLNTYPLIPRTGSKTTIYLPDTLTWIRFEIRLDTVAVHDDYTITIKTADGRPVTSVDWIEPLTPNQTIIDTPVVSTIDLPSGNYVLLLMGKQPNGSFVKVAECSFKLMKY